MFPGVDDFDVIVTFTSDAKLPMNYRNVYHKLYDSADSVFETFTP